MDSQPAEITVKRISTSHYFSLLPAPKVPHLILLEERLLSRLIVIGDIHGCYHELLNLLNKCEYNPIDSQVILLGDLVNKGPHSAAVVKFARRNGFFCVRGNHDLDALVYALEIHPNSTNRPPYLSYLDELEQEDVEWLRELPFTISIPSKDIGFVHAGVIPDIPFHHQKPTDMVLMRNIYMQDNLMVGTFNPDIGEPWISKYNGKPINHLFFGHDAKRGLQTSNFATGLDTGCVYGKKNSVSSLPFVT